MKSMKRIHKWRLWVYVAWSLSGQNGKSWVAHFSNLSTESVGKFSDFGDYEIVSAGRVGRSEALAWWPWALKTFE